MLVFLSMSFLSGNVRRARKKVWKRSLNLVLVKMMGYDLKIFSGRIESIIATIITITEVEKERCITRLNHSIARLL
jgi:hypothetical protein